MPFNHNDCYHPRLLRAIPPGASTALDVGCGTGKFARRLAAANLDVHAVDVDCSIIDIARTGGSPGPGTIDYRCQDVTDTDLPLARYDYISCLASIHHVSFETVVSLRAALRPGGVLVILGLATPRSPADLMKWLVLAPPLNLIGRALVTAGERLNGGAEPQPTPPIKDWNMSMTQIRRESADLLPGRTVQPLMFWRYLLIYRSPKGDSDL